MDERLEALVVDLRAKHDTARNMIPRTQRRVRNALEEYADSVEALVQYLAIVREE
jgi:rhodanese-related sulfurtransferase